jgi:hypothetical protein
LLLAMVLPLLLYMLLLLLSSSSSSSSVAMVEPAQGPGARDALLLVLAGDKNA